MFFSEFKKKGNFLWIAFTLLIVVFSIPVLASWLQILWQRPLESNLLQIGSGIILVFSLVRHFKKKPLLLQNILNPSWPGLLALLIIFSFHGLTDFLHIKSLYWMSYLIVLSFLCWALGGLKLFRNTLPYFLFSAFLLPVINAEIHTTISLPLQLVSTWLATQLSAIFIPLSYHQNMMYIKGDTFEITADCSGLQSWVGFIFAGLLRQLIEGVQTLELALLIPLSLLLALLLNSVRLCLTALTAYFTSADQAMAIHTNLDYILLPIGFYCIWEFGHWIKSKFPQTSIKQEPLAPEATKLFKKRIITTAVAMLLASATVFHFVVNQSYSTQDKPSLTIPMRLANWQGAEEELSDAEKQSLAGAQIVNRSYQNKAKQRLFLTVLKSHSPEFIHNFWGCLIGQGIQPKVATSITLKLAQKTFKVPVIQYEYNQNRFYEIIWYQWDTGLTADRWQWYKAVLHSFSGQTNSSWKVVTLTMQASPTATPDIQNQEYQTLQEFSELTLNSIIDAKPRIQ